MGAGSLMTLTEMVIRDMLVDFLAIPENTPEQTARIHAQIAEIDARVQARYDALQQQ